MSAPLDTPMLVEWVDSAQPLPGWRFLEDAPEMEIVECCSVGWVVGETEGVLMLAPNLGDRNSKLPQASGFIRIPKQAITRKVSLVETQ